MLSASKLARNYSQFVSIHLVIAHQSVLSRILTACHEPFGALVQPRSCFCDALTISASDVRVYARQNAIGAFVFIVLLRFACLDLHPAPELAVNISMLAIPHFVPHDAVSSINETAVESHGVGFAFSYSPAKNNFRILILSSASSSTVTTFSCDCSSA